MESNLMAINTYHMTLNTSNVKTPDSWIECNRIGNLVMINGCAKITKAVNTYSVLNIASGAPVPCCNKQLYTVAIAQDNTYSKIMKQCYDNKRLHPIFIYYSQTARYPQNILIYVKAMNCESAFLCQMISCTAW